MPVTTAARTVMLDAFASVAEYASLHSANPGDIGENELTGGTYTRVPVTWTSGALESSPIFDVPAGAIVAHVGFWSADGTFTASARLPRETYTGPGTYTLTAADVDLT